MLDWLVQICKQKWIHFRIIWKIILKTCFQVKTHNLLTTISSPVQQQPQLAARVTGTPAFLSTAPKTFREFTLIPTSCGPRSQRRSDAWWGGFWTPSDGGWEKSTISNIGRYTSSTCFLFPSVVHVSFQGCSSESEKGGGWKMMFLFKKGWLFRFQPIIFRGVSLKELNQPPLKDEYVGGWANLLRATHLNKYSSTSQLGWT